MDGIFAVDMDGNVNMSNPAARQFFAIRPDEQLSKKELESFLPPGFLEKANLFSDIP